MLYRQYKAANLQQLGEQAKAEWHSIPEEEIQNLIISSFKRIEAVVRAIGDYSRY